MINEVQYIDRKWHYWTRGAVECYNRSCICEGCPVKEILSSECRMKYAVISLVRTSGLPPQITTLKKEEKLVDTIAKYIDKGFNLKEIAQKLNMDYWKVLKMAKLYGLNTTCNKANWRKKKNENKS